jgi:hypothetical protein
MPSEDQPRSTLVTRVGRLFLLGSVALLALTLSQLLVLVSPAGPPQARPTQYGGISEALILLAASILLYASTMSVSFALLKRIAWARPAFIGMLGFGIVLNLARLLLSSLSDDQPELPSEGPAPYLMIMRVSTILDVLVPLATIVFFAWLIVKLSSQAVRAEFSRG